MKKLLSIILLFSLSLASEALAQAPKNVQMSQQSATRGQIIEDLSFGSGRTGSFLAGSTLTIAGTLSGTPAAGTLNLSNLTLTLPSTFPTAAQLSAVNGSGPNSGTGRVHWSQIEGMPAGFADGSDDGAGGGSGTVTSFSAGNAGTLFTTSVATPTSTPALTFSLSAAAQNSVWAGPVSGGAGAPSYRLLVADDIPTLPLAKISGTGDAAAKNTGATAGTVAAGDDSRFTDARTPTDGSVTTTKIAAATLVTAAEGIGSNDNDASIPTSAAVKAYADSVASTGNVTAGTPFAVGNITIAQASGEIITIPISWNATNSTLTIGGNLTANTLNISAFTGELAGEHGGTGVANTGKTITLGGNLTTSGANNIIFTTTGDSNVTMPTSGTLATVGGNLGAATATTPAEDDNSTKVATTAYVQTEIASLGGGGSAETGDIKFILDSASVPAGWALTGANGIPAITSPDADAKAVIKMAGTVATPTFSPVAGAVPSGQTITFSSATSGVTFMTTNNTTDPSRSVGTAGGTWTISANQTIETMAYKDGAYLIDSAVASAAYTIDPVPTLTGAEINGTALTLTYSEAVSRGGSYSNAHFDLDMSTGGSNIGVTYVSGDGTTTHTYTAATAAVNGETVDLDFSGVANSIEETGGYNQDLAAITSAAVTNSTAGGGASFSDNFNRTNETPITGDWIGTGLSGWAADTYLLTNAVSNSGGNALARVKTTTASFASNQWAETAVVAGNDMYCGPAVRIQGDTNGNCYFAFYAGSSTWHIQKGDGTTNAAVGSTISAAGPSTNDVIRLEASGDGTSTTLTLKLNGSTLGSRTDSSSPYTGGQPGAWTGSGLFVDNFNAGDL